jgi:LysM repeat protein
MIKQVFVSYSRDDYSFVEKLVNDLTNLGVEIWLDQRDIKAGQRWDTAVQQALRDSEYFLVVLSPVSVNSHNVLDEISYALNKNKHVFPIIYKDCDIPYRLARIQYVDFREDYKDGKKRLLSEIEIAGVPIKYSEKEDFQEIESESEKNGDSKRAIPVYAWIIGGLGAVLLIAGVTYYRSGEITPIPTYTKPVITEELGIPETHPFEFVEKCSEDKPPPCIYSVKTGDSFSQIALDLYGSTKYTPLIMNMNRDDDGTRPTLLPGDELKIPPQELSIEWITRYLYKYCASNNRPCVYKVRNNDTYETIAENYYGKAIYSELMEKNNWISVYDPDNENYVLETPKLYEDLVIVLPAKR